MLLHCCQQGLAKSREQVSVHITGSVWQIKPTSSLVFTQKSAVQHILKFCLSAEAKQKKLTNRGLIRDHPLCLCMFKACWLNRPACMPPRKLSTLSTRRCRPPPAVVHMWHHRHLSHTFVVLFFFSFPSFSFPLPSALSFAATKDKRSPQHTSRRGEKCAAERATLRKNKQISKHFYIKTSNVPRDETTRRSQTHWQPQNLW